MEERSLAYALYWRNSLADAELGHGIWKRDIKSFRRLVRDELSVGRVNKETVEACFAHEPMTSKTVGVVIRPKVYFARLEHVKSRRDGAPHVVTPLVTPALLARDGRLYPSSNTVVPRDLLEPLESRSFAIGSVADLDRFLTADPVPGVIYADVGESLTDLEGFEAQWNKYLEGCERLSAHVCQGWPGESGAFVAADYGYLVKKKWVEGISRHILPLYDHMREHAPSAPLFDRYADEAIGPPEICLPADDAFSARLGHASDAYPLAAAQRNALTHLLASRPGEILAVNGPPGTGKTTLLLSIVASLWAKAALDGGEPPVILAASSNNQAVTNIIDAFGRDFATGDGPFAGRWLPDIKSFGAYFPSLDKESKPAGEYQTRSFFESIESQDYVAEALARYLAFATAALPSSEALTVESIVEALQQCIRDEAGKLATIEAAWRRLAEARAEVRVELGDDPAAEQAQRQQRGKTIGAEMRAWNRLAKRYEAYLAQESVFYSLFAWLPPVRKKRLRLARLFLEQDWQADFAQEEWQDVERIEAAIKLHAEKAAHAEQAQQLYVRRGEQTLQMERARLAEWASALATLGVTAHAECMSLAEADERADKVIRFQVFRLATHYWEGRWLLDMKALLSEIDEEKRKNGRVAVEKRWRRRMKLTPCVVSTFYMLPKEMKVSRHVRRGFIDDYLYDFADLLIVDEAGQALPEVAGASFALSKAALIIGDTLQIEPIWSIPAPVDMGNLLGAELLTGADQQADYARLSDLGKTAASGNVMRIAQCASRWHGDPDFSRGLFLYEHRRSFDEIIGYCNSLCYHGKLIPMRGMKAAAAPDADGSKDGLPAMGYLHVDGICRQSNGGSRENLLEAEIIAAWLAAKREELEATYGKPLCEIVGVITPFGAQVGAITRACRAADIIAGNEAHEVTVGTVHSLQGAQRPVVIFSAVYSKHADGGFIDRSASMLNVAVSRARNTFLVFGDMDVFELAPPAKPRGQLAAVLFSDEAHALCFAYRPRRDLTTPRIALTQLRDAKEHDAFLADVLFSATREVHIVSPWIRPGCIEESGAMEGMVAATDRGVKVRVYTDGFSNTHDRDPLARERKRREFCAGLEALRARKIEPIVVSRVHSKIVIGDDNVYCVGSFNWFSAVREDNRHETSLAYRGPDLRDEIEVMKHSLRLRAAPTLTSPRHD